MYSRVYVEITNICNRACTFCPGTKREKRRMTVDEFSLILDKLEGITKYIYLHVMGEPLTHPELPTFISMASARGFKCAITTNGTLLGRRGRDLIDSDLYKINVSVHSFESGEREEYLAYINSCIDFADEASRRGILTVLRLWNRGYDEGRNIDTLAILRERFADGEWRYGANGARIRHRLHLEYGDRFEWPDVECDELGDQVFCHGLGDHFGILVDGRVVPCCLDREAAIELGNVYDSDLGDILACERAEAMREGFRSKRATEELCRKCGYARRFKL
jgi:radical SAM protein with 4Fe4S-binding SPASM domain